MKKVGILTLQFANNYGGFMQVFALSKTLEELGFVPIIIDRIPNKKTSLLKKIVITLTNPIHSYLNSSFTDFKREYLNNRTPVIRTNEELLNYKDEFFAVIVGSDQVWRLAYTKDEGLGYNMFLDFVGDKTLKLSYAASFGTDKFEGSNEDIQQVKKYLKKFSAVSVREDSGVSLCKNTFNIASTHVLDPTLLLNSQDYIKLFSLQPKNEERTLGYYFLDFTKDKAKIVEDLAVRMNYKHVNIYRKSAEAFNISKHLLPTKEYKYPSFSHWLTTIYNSDFVVADSFHGIVFSIIFNKQFICIANKSRGIARMESLLKMFDLQDRIVYEGQLDYYSKVNKLIDYESVNRILSEKQTFSKKFLEQVLAN